MRLCCWSCTSIIAWTSAQVKTLNLEFRAITIPCANPVIEPTGSANIYHTSSPLANWPCYHSLGDATMWQICFAVFVIPTAVVTALAVVEILTCGGN
jgi:hypothetical protein